MSLTQGRRKEYQDFDSMNYKEQWDYSRKRIILEVAIIVPFHIFLAVWATLKRPSFELAFFLIVGLS